MLNLNLDPRAFVIPARLKKIKKIIAVSGFKGGVGKSTAACVLSLVLAKKGFKVGLADLDLTSSSCHTILGADIGPGKIFPEEVEGLLPPEIEGIKFMSVAFFTSESALNLRGAQISNTILELFAVTNWGELDYLVLDMPPGISDAALDVLRYVPQAEILCITTPSIVARNILSKAVQMLLSQGAKFLGFIENGSSSLAEDIAGLENLGSVSFESAFETFLGNPKKLLGSSWADFFNRTLETGFFK